MEWAVWEEQIVEFTSLERFPGDRTKKLVAENNSENIRIRKSTKKPARWSCRHISIKTIQEREGIESKWKKIGQKSDYLREQIKYL